MQIRPNQSLLVTLVVVVLGVTLLLLGRVFAPWPMFSCANYPKQELRSGDAKYVAGVFERSCGATTTPITYINLRTRRPWFLGGKNQDVLELDGQCAIGLTWMSDTLRVSYPESCKVLYRVEAALGGQIQFKTGPP